MTATTTAPATIDLSQAIDRAISGLRSGSSAAGAGSSSTAADQVGALMLAGLHDALRSNPGLVASATTAKSYQAPTALTPDVVAQKDFWSSLGSILNTVAPIVIDALSKDYQPPAKSQVVVPDHLAQDKDFWTFLQGALTTVVPPLIGALQGKEFSVSQAPAIPPGKDKGWFDDAMNVVAKVAPTVLPIVLSLI